MVHKQFYFFLLFFLFPSLIVATEHSCYLQIDILPHHSQITGQLTVDFHRSASYRLLDNGFSIKNIALKFKAKTKKKYYQIVEGQQIQIEFSGTIASKSPNKMEDHKISLQEAWFPQLQDIDGKVMSCHYSLQVKLPPSYMAISETANASKKIKDNVPFFYFSYKKPQTNITLYASNLYKIEKQDLELKSGTLVSIETWLFAEHAHLSKVYLSQMEKYLHRYFELFGFIPFQRFAVVESWEGAWLSGLLVMDSKMLSSSYNFLAHGLVRQWLGNHVKMKDELGSWADALSSYIVSHFAVLPRQSKLFRHDLLYDYQLYREQDSLSLFDYNRKSNPMDAALGYGKGAMIFHLLRMQMGEEKFFQTVVQLSQNYAQLSIGWDEVIDTFNENQQGLSAIMWPWLSSVGLINMDFTAKYLSYEKGIYRTTIALTSANNIPNVAIEFPVWLHHSQGVKILKLNNAYKDFTNDFSIESQNLPLQMAVDPQYDLPRILTITERGVSFKDIDWLWLSKKQKIEDLVVVVDELDLEFFSSLLAQVSVKTIQPEQVDAFTIEQNNLLYLFRYQNKNDFLLRFLKLPLEQPKSVFKSGAFRIIPSASNKYFRAAIGVGDTSLEQLWNLFSKQASFSYIQVHEDKVVDAQRSAIQDGSYFDLFQLQILTPKGQITFEEAMTQIKNESIICIGEQHNQLSHHLAQLRIIQELVANKKKVVIGLEMFPQESQPSLDRYIFGKINEQQFLLESKYYEVWGFPYDLYKPILDYAREKRIPVKALNIQRNVIRQVAKQGLKNLPNNLRKLLPAQIDTSNEQYRIELKKFFDNHHNAHSNSSFEYFFEAQVSWDEMMAEQAAYTWKKNPQAVLVVLAGSGHLKNYGIPMRIKKRTGQAPFVLLPANVSKEQLDFDGDYLFQVPLLVENPIEKNLGIVVEKNGQNKIVIKRFSPGSILKMIGIQENDIIEAINDQMVHEIYALKTHLYFAEKGKEIKVTIRRNNVPMIFYFNEH